MRLLLSDTHAASIHQLTYLIYPCCCMAPIFVALSICILGSSVGIIIMMLYWSDDYLMTSLRLRKIHSFFVANIIDDHRGICLIKYLISNIKWVVYIVPLPPNNTCIYSPDFLKLAKYVRMYVYTLTCVCVLCSNPQ